MPNAAHLYFGWSVQLRGGGVESLWLGRVQGDADADAAGRRVSGTWSGEVWGVVQDGATAPLFTSVTPFFDGGDVYVQVRQLPHCIELSLLLLRSGSEAFLNRWEQVEPRWGLGIHNTGIKRTFEFQSFSKEKDVAVLRMYAPSAFRM